MTTENSCGDPRIDVSPVQISTPSQTYTPTIVIPPSGDLQQATPPIIIPQLCLSTTYKSRIGTDWKAEFRPEEMVEKGDVGKCVRLRGLQRCANMCGIIESYPEMRYIERTGRPGIMQCIYHVKFTDGSHFAGAADVNENNVDSKFAAYPTSVAESRAEARALRKALNITDMIAAEEIGSSEGGSTGQPDTNMNGKIEPQQVAAINALIDQLKIPLANVLVEVFSKEKAQTIFSLEENLTVSEGVSILRYLNEKRASLDTQPPVSSTKKISIDKKKGN